MPEKSVLFCSQNPLAWNPLIWLSNLRIFSFEHFDFDFQERALDLCKIFFRYDEVGKLIASFACLKPNQAIHFSSSVVLRPTQIAILLVVFCGLIYVFYVAKIVCLVFNVSTLINEQYIYKQSVCRYSWRVCTHHIHLTHSHLSDTAEH